MNHMEEIYRKARAKINLNLKITGIREDHYHNIESIFQKINLYDEIWIQKTKTGKCELQINVPELNSPENIIVKAYEILKKQYPSEISGVFVKVKKNIPMQAGLGGGSTDCATFLFGMNQLFSLALPQRKIEEIGKSLGADVVPCLFNQPVKAEGIGDQITAIPSNFRYDLVLIKPNLACDTKAMYQKFDQQKGIVQADTTDQIIQALIAEDKQQLAENLYNVFENVVDSPEIIQNLKKELMQNGAIGSLMTGSGSCVYGIFKNKQEARQAYQGLKEKYQTYLCTSYYSTKGEKKC